MLIMTDGYFPALPCRQRPAVGKCLAAFSAAFPVAFLEPHIDKFNSFSIYNGKGTKDRAGASVCLSPVCVYVLQISPA